MPIGRGPRPGARSLIVLGGTILAISLVLVFMVVYLADGSKVRLGKNQFDDLSAERTATRIRNDGPIQFPDVSGGTRVVVLSHLGEDAAAARIDKAVADHLATRGGATLSTGEVGKRIRERL